MNEIRKVTMNDKKYPESLKKISDPPKILYYKGVLPKNESCIAIVGTRRPSEYGQRATLQVAGELSKVGIVIVSGMAPGIDTFAHKSCIEKGVRTIAVLGTGLDEKSIYPQQNLQLSRDIIKNGGCLISEFAPGTPGYPNNFRQRNRIISGLSLGALIVEAKEKSGSLITADFAKIQRKKLFAIPGQIYALNSMGPNKLIKEGATLIESSQDILDVLEISTGSNSVELDTKLNRMRAENSEEAAILTALKEESLCIDKIIEITKLPAPVVGSSLALMEISGKIRHLGGNIYAIA